MADDLALAVPSSNGLSADNSSLSPTEPGRAVTRPSPTKSASRPLRAKPPKDSKVFKVALAVVALRAQGQKYSDIALALNYSESTIQTYVKRAVRKGWINRTNFDDPDDQLDQVIKEKVVNNIDAALGERNEDGQLTAGARQMTIETAKGIGMFKQHQVVKGDMNANVGVALRVQVEMPPIINSIVKIQPGTTGGAPAKEIPADAEIIELEEA